MSDITFDKVIELAQLLPKFKIDVSKQHIEARCPFCGDSKTKKNVRRFYIDFYGRYNTYIYKCFRCGESGDIISLYAYYKNISYNEASKILTNKVYNPEEIKKKLLAKKQLLQDQIEEELFEIDSDLDIDIKNECYSLDSKPDSKIAYNAISKLINFKRDRHIPDNLPIYIAHSGKYKSRIIVPIYINNKMVYFQGRSLYDDILPKYLNPKVKKDKIILNIDNFDPDKYIVVCEGIIDAYMLENNQGTCVIGGYVDKKYINKILKYTNKGVIICLDNPRIDDNSYNVLKKLINENINKYTEKIKFFVMPKEYDAKDLNDLVKDYKMKNIYEFVVNNKYSILYMKHFLLK